MTVRSIYIKDFSDGDLIEELVARFRQRNDFVKNIDVLQEVTPNAWYTQVDAAAEQLRSNLEGACTTIDGDLHNGKFFKG